MSKHVLMAQKISMYPPYTFQFTFYYYYYLLSIWFEQQTNLSVAQSIWLGFVNEIGRKMNILTWAP